MTYTVWAVLAFNVQSQSSEKIAVVSCCCRCVCVSVAVFAEARDRLAGHIVNYGYVESRDLYLGALAAGDVVVSTAQHEFFGVAMYAWLTGRRTCYHWASTRLAWCGSSLPHSLTYLLT